MAKSQNSNLHGILKCPNSIFHSQVCGSLKNQDLAITVTLRTSCQVVPEQGRGSLELLKIPILRHFHCFFFLLVQKLGEKLPSQGMSLLDLVQVVLVVKNPLASAGDLETWVQSLSWEDPLEDGMATHSAVLAWRIPWTEQACRLQFIGSQRVRHD